MDKAAGIVYAYHPAMGCSIPYASIPGTRLLRVPRQIVFAVKAAKLKPL